MGACRNIASHAKITLGKIERTTRVQFAVLGNIENCTKIDAQNYFALTGTNPVYNRFDRPEDRFNCNGEGCRNTGTLSVTATGTPSTASFKYKVPYDSTEFYGGLTTYYLYFDEAGTYTVDTTIGDIGDETLSNADTYEKTITVEEPGFYPIVVDFSQVPDDITGNGWVATEAGALISVDVSNSGSTAFRVGISSFYFYDDITDFQTNEVVEMDCLSDLSADLTVDAIDAECSRGGYDSSSVGYEYTITGKKPTPNYHLLNPLEGKGVDTVGWEIQGDEREVRSVEFDGETYGYIQVPDMDLTECAFVQVTLKTCSPHDSMMHRVSVPNPMPIDERQFIVLDGTTTTALDGGIILVNSAIIGQILTVTYPRERQVTRYIGNNEYLNEKMTELVFTVCYNDGVKEVRRYKNVLITSFPLSITQDETEFSFTVTIQQDTNGDWYQRDIIRA